MEKPPCEDKFTPEGVPVTSPFRAGMPGPMDWRHETKRSQRAQGDDENKETA